MDPAKPPRESLTRLNILARKSSPRWMRTLYRLSRAFAIPPVSESLPAELLEDCKFCASREALLDRLPKRGVVAELGTARGNFARRIVMRTDPRELHLVDIEFSNFVDKGLTESRVKRHQGLTHEIIATFPDAYFDWIYVDADHSYSGTLRDARSSAPKIKPGGFIVFNDFAHMDPELGRYGVHRAVTQFAREEGWRVAFFAFHPQALYDIALQKNPGDSSSP